VRKLQSPTATLLKSGKYLLPRRARAARLCVVRSILITLGLLFFSASVASVAAQTGAPILISQSSSTRAIAVDSLTLTPEPFPVISRFGDSAQRTRVMVFAMNLNLQPGEDFSAVSADAEDAAHRHYVLAVESIRPVPSYEWLNAIVLRLADDLGDVGDVLVRVSYQSLASNRARIAIGHVGGGPPDDPGATPTPVRPFTLRGQVRDDNNGLLAGIELRLTDRTDSTTAIATTAADGGFSFSVAPGHSVTVAPAATVFFSFNAQAVAAISRDSVLNFSGTRRTYSISGRLTGAANHTDGVRVNLSGSQTATTISDNNGEFLFTGLPPGVDYVITVPTTPYYTFVAKNFNNLSANQIADCPGTLRYYTISGRVQLDQYPAAFLQIPISGSPATTITTDENGRFSTDLPAGGNYTFTPSAPYYRFIPASFSYTDLTSNQFNLFIQGLRESFSISGRLTDQENHSLSGFTVNLGGPEPLTAVTDAIGNYHFSNLFAGYNYTVTPPSTAAYTFTGQNVNDLRNDRTVDFLGLHRWLLSGRVRNQDGAGLRGITLTLTGTENATATTAADGSYAFVATATGNYSVTPSIPQALYSFTPAAAQLDNLAGPRVSDFTGTFTLFTDPSYVLEFDGQPKTVDYGNFWPEGVNLGHFFWEFWAMPGAGAGATYMLSDGYGGAHALLFGVGSFNSSEANRYELLGNIFDGITFDNYFGSDVGPAVGEWAHFAVGWDGQNIITYYNGVPAGKTPFRGPRRTPGPSGGGGRLLIGGSDHSNFDGRIAQVRGYEDTNPREGSPGSAEASFAPQTVFGLGGNLLSYYFRSSPRLIADLSQGYGGSLHTGFSRGTGTGILYDCETCPPPRFVIDPSAPNFAAGAPSSPVNVPPPATPPAGALVFDSFSRANSTYTFGGNGGLGSTESGSAGPQLWETNQGSGNPQPFGILNARAVLLGNSTAVAWVPTGSPDGNLDIRVNRYRGHWGSGIHSGVSFRVLNAANFFFAYTADSASDQQSKVLHVGYYQNGNRVDLVNDRSIPAAWSTLKVVTLSSGALDVYIDNQQVYQTNQPALASAKGAGLFSDSVGKGLVNRWDNFTVFEAPQQANEPPLLTRRIARILRNH